MSTLNHSTHSGCQAPVRGRVALRSKAIISAIAFCAFSLGFTPNSGAVELIAQAEIAAAPPALLRVEVSAVCADQGAVFKIANRGEQWPRTGLLRLYYADDHSLIGQRRLRLADHQRISFAVKNNVVAGRPVGVWLDPGWYKRSFKFDAQMTCP